MLPGPRRLGVKVLMFEVQDPDIDFGAEKDRPHEAAGDSSTILPALLHLEAVLLVVEVQEVDTRHGVAVVVVSLQVLELLRLGVRRVVVEV